VGLNALASHGLVFHVLAAALRRSITSPRWKPPAAKGERKGRGKPRRGGRKVLLLEEKCRLLLRHLPAERRSVPGRFPQQLGIRRSEGSVHPRDGMVLPKGVVGAEWEPTRIPGPGTGLRCLVPDVLGAVMLMWRDVLLTHGSHLS